MQSFIVLGGAGCLLLLLIIGNFLFGWLFFKPLPWIAIEVSLILLFRLNIFISKKHMQRGFSQQRRSHVIDVEGKVVEDKDKGDYHAES